VTNNPSKNRINHRFLVFFLISTLFLIPQTVSANAGTPLMWAGMLHLVLGNVFIGLGEGILIAAIFKRPKLRCIGLMIAANYFSAWVGGVWLAGNLATKLDWHLYNAWNLFWQFVLGTYLGTLILEFPIIALCFWKSGNWFKRSLRASLLVQTISYICLFGWYWGASGKSLYTRMHIVQPSEIRLQENLELYFISAPDGHVHQGSQIVGNVISTNQNDRLLIKPIVGEINRWELVMRLDGRRDEDVKGLKVVSQIEAIFTSVEDVEENQPNGPNTWFNFGDVVVMGETNNRNWEIGTGFWPVEGMRIKNTRTEREYRFAWETLFSRWAIRNAILLPDDIVIFQLGQDQICAVEPATRKIALLARGCGPVVVLK
jgi:hypothetical protein